MTGVGSIAAALDLVGPRLQTRSATSVLYADGPGRAHGVLRKTRCRGCENGQRRPSLELLLPLAQAYGVPLDTGGHTGGGRPARPAEGPERDEQDRPSAEPSAQRRPGLEDRHPRAHGGRRSRARTDGYEWLYVLSGRMRLVLGERDLVLETGEAAEFDTQLPRSFGRHRRTRRLGRPGERMHVRARSRREEPAG